MPLSGEQLKLHSAEYFGEQRDYWWNQDHLALAAQRAGLSTAKRVLDVGSGVGHWGRTILPHLSAEADITGVDREPEWVRIASETAAARGLNHRLRYVQGRAEELPFPDESFDLVTCQTLLLHVRDYRVVVREMLRVLRPGGRLFLVEPNNLASAALRASSAPPEQLDSQLRLFRFQAICERGKEAAGEGYNSVGDRIPGYLASLGVESLEVRQSDHAYPMFPPYATPAQQALKAQLIDWAERGIWIWTEQDTRRYFAAGGGADREFDTLWSLALADARRTAAELQAGRYSDAGGSVVYIISARKPS